NLIDPADELSGLDSYVHDRLTGHTLLVSRTWNGGIGNYGSFISQISPDGKYIMFDSEAGNLTPVEDTVGLKDTLYITRNPATVNQQPVLSQISNKSVDEGQALTFTVSATDPDGDALTYSASNLPAGATFDPDTRTFSWTPTYDQAGSYPNV